ncbi:MAG: Rrf2 family transcriptional regulator [Pirellulales bacterium]|jgi:Rrf2 family protein
MKLSRTIAYAIHATLQLAGGERGVPIPCSQLATEGQMPERFLLQILRSLVTRGLLCSTRGVDGGYYLARPADQISLRDIVEAFDNPLAPTIPALDALSPDVRKRIMSSLHAASASAHNELSKLTMADLMRSSRNGS